MRLFQISIVLAVLGSFTGSPAIGGDFLSSASGARSIATGGVYIPTSENVLEAFAINPAGLALLGRPTVELSVAGLFARGRFTNAQHANGTLSASGAIPYAAFGMPLGNSRFSLGVAAVPQLLSAAKWRYTDPPGGVNSVSYGEIDHNSEILAMRFTVGAGWSVSPKLQVGATVGAVYNSNILQTAYVFQSNPALAGLKTLLDLRVEGIGWNGSAGAIYRLSRRLSFGAAYQSRTSIVTRGEATGNAGLQFARIGLGSARPDFRYDARVDDTLPASAVVHAVWQASWRTRILGQADWVNWKQAFTELPVLLTNGNNSDINGVLGTNVIRDSVPLKWRNQVILRGGIERSWLENAVLRAGYARSNAFVPDATLSPLTAAITQDRLSAGAGVRRGRCRFDLAYTLDPTTRRSVQDSALKSGEYANSRIHVGIQGLVLTTSIGL